MPGLMSRILSRRADGAPPLSEATDPADQPTTALPAAAPDAAEQPTALIPTAPGTAATTDEAAGLPAGAEPAPPLSPSFRDRGRLRRRLRYLRRIRELGLRDLGGLVFDLDRFGRDRQDLVRAKLDALGAIDRELRALEVALQDIRPVEELEEPGVASCAACGVLHGSEARFCPACGTPVDAPAPAALKLPAAAPQPEEPPAAAAEPTADAAASEPPATEPAEQPEAVAPERQPAA